MDTSDSADSDVTCRSAGVRSVVVCGAPRSGTSMMAECFIRAGYHAGTRLIPASTSNPHGFFEDLEVNRINDQLLARHFVERLGVPAQLAWMGAHEADPAAPGATSGVDALLARRMVAATPSGPFVVKDPRLSYTMPWWRPILGPCAVVVLVRPAHEVFKSLVAMALREPDYFEHVVPDEASVGAMWSAVYRSALAWADDATMFVDATAVRNGTVLTALSRLTGVALTTGSVDRRLHRQRNVTMQPLDGVEGEVATAVAERCRSDFAREGISLDED